MAVSFTDERETSAGPLDVVKNAGGDNVGQLDDSYPLDGNAALDGGLSAGDVDSNSADEEELLRQKNPLGYTVTPPTEREIEAGQV